MLQEFLDYATTHTEAETRKKFSITQVQYREKLKEARAKNLVSASEKAELATLKREVDLYKEVGSPEKAAKILGIPRTTFSTRMLRAKRLGLLSEIEESSLKEDKLSRENRILKEKLKEAKENQLSYEELRERIFKISSLPADPPKWIVDTNKMSAKSPGIPSLFLSDIHFGEVVDPSQINGVNEYSVAIAKQRMRLLVTRTIKLLKYHMVSPDYPGIVLNCGGDLFSGDIHEELIDTNEKDIMLVFTDLFGVLIWCIETLADHFGKVFIPFVSGNHSRITKKVRAKGFNYTNFDFLMGHMLEAHFQKDKRIQFFIPNGPDALFKIYDYRYLLTHGNQFRGGDGLIGALGPIIRGDHKKRSRNTQINMEYDTMLLGHFHQIMLLKRVIVNGSVVGYNEFAFSENMGFEVPQQALWITHPEHGITFSIPVYLTDSKEAITSDWVSWQDGK